jgi:hypothetical protein
MEDILRETGTTISTSMTAEEALRPPAESPDDRPPPDPGDEDPSRDIPSAEMAMSFSGHVNHGSVDLEAHLERRFAEIAKRRADAARQDAEDVEAEESEPRP